MQTNGTPLYSFLGTIQDKIYTACSTLGFHSKDVADRILNFYAGCYLPTDHIVNADFVYRHLQEILKIEFKFLNELHKAVSKIEPSGDCSLILKNALKEDTTQSYEAESIFIKDTPLFSGSFVTKVTVTGGDFFEHTCVAGSVACLSLDGEETDTVLIDHVNYNNEFLWDKENY